MVPRSILRVFVYALPVLIVGFAVVMGGYLIALGVGDPLGARALLWIALALVMLLAVDLILLVGALGVNALARPPGGEEPRDA